MNVRLSDATVFSGVDLPKLLVSGDGVGLVGFAAGEVIYAEGDEGGRLFLIVEGKVRVGCRSTDGRECMFTVLGPTEIFGEESALERRPRTACATAVTDMQAVSMGRAALLSLVTANPDIGDRLLRVLARRIRWTTSNITDAVYANVTARVAKQLLGLAQRFGTQEEGATRVPMDLTQEQFAHLVGTSRESVNKALTDFTERGWIRTEGDSILIHDSAPLVNQTHGARRLGRQQH